MINIDLTPRGAFSVTCHPNEAGPVRRIPGVRWNAASRAWIAQSSRLAKLAVLDLSHRAGVQVTEQANAELLAPAPAIVSKPWPDDYPWRTRPYDHQMEAIRFAHGRRVVAFHMEMGTGKSKCAIDLFSAAHIDGSVNNALVICPVSIRRNWQNEFAVHCPVAVSTHVLDSSRPKAFEHWLATPTTLPRALIVGVESLAAGKAIVLASEYMRTVPGPVMGIIDEAHTVKNHSAVRTQNASSLLKQCARRINMTGTPTANSILDLYSQFHILDPGIIGLPTYWAFRERYAVMGGFEGRQVVGFQNLPELMESVLPHVYQVLKKDCLDLPPKVYETRYIQLTAQQSKTYKELAKHGASSSGITTTMVLERMLRQQQVIAGFESIEGVESAVNDKTPPKITELLDIAETNTDSMIIWSVFRWEIARICEALRAKYGDDSVVEIHGDIGPEDRQRNVELFQAKQARFLVGTAAAGGVGLTLTAATVMVYVSNSFSYTQRAQSEDRFHRIGQTADHVTIIDLVAEGTVDEDIAEALASKLDVATWLAEQRR